MKQIAEGFYNFLLNKKEELYNERIIICRDCKLLTKDSIFGEMCNKHLYLNKDTNETSFTNKPGFQHGCGCVLSAKLRQETEPCPLGKWK